MTDNFLPRRILRYLNASTEPQSVKAIADHLKVSDQTVRNGLKVLQKDGKVEVADKIGNSPFWSSVNESKNITIVWGGESLNPSEKLKEWGRVGMPKENFARKIAIRLVQIYKLALRSLEDDPTPISPKELKRIQIELRDIKDKLSQRLMAVNSLLDNPLLWDPTLMARDLVMLDSSAGIEELQRAIDLIEFAEMEAANKETSKVTEPATDESD